MTRPKLPKAAELTAPKKARQQFAVVPAYVVLDRTITPAQKTVMQVICLHANADGWAWPTLQTIGEILGVQKPQVSKMIDALAAAGCLEVHFRTHNGKRKMFCRVIYDRPQETLEAAHDEARDEPALVSATEKSAEATGFHEGNDWFPPRKLPVSTMETPFFEHTKEQTKEQRTPPPGREAVGLETAFEDPAHREVYRALRATHRLPQAFDATLRKLHQPITGGPAHTWPEIGAALLAQAGNGESFNELRLRGYLRAAREVPPARAGARMSRNDAPGGFVGTQPWQAAARTRDGQPYSAPGFWDLCRTHGLLQAMLTLGTVDEIVQRLQATGAVESAEAFKALVLHVKPWALAEIKFAKTREEQLAAALATFPASTQGAA